MTEEMESETPEGSREQDEVRNKMLMEHNNFLRERIARLTKENTGLRGEVERLEAVADRNYKWFLSAHDAINMLRQDAETAMREGGAWELHLQLTEAREDMSRLREKHRRNRTQWTDLTKKAIAAKAEESQKRRDLEAALEAMRKKAAQHEAERDEVTRTAEKTIGDLEAKLHRIAEQCELWHRGELDTMSAIAGITGEMRGFPLPEPGIWERSKAIRAAEILSQHREMADQLAQIEAVLEDAGVQLVSTHEQQVRDLVQLYRGQQEQLDELRNNRTGDCCD